MGQAPLSSTFSQHLFKFMSIEPVMLSDHLILCCHFLLLPSVFPYIRAFLNESALCISWPKYCSFSFSISPSNEYTGCISFRIDWFDLLPYPYMITGKAVTLNICTFVSKVMSLLFNVLSRFVIAFLPGSKCLLIS